MRHGGDRVRDAVGHVRVERQAGLVRLVGAGEGHARGGGRTGASDVEVEAVEVNLDLAFQVLSLELLHVSVHRDELGTQDIVAGLDVAGQLEFEAVAIIVGELVGPSICWC